MRTRTTQSAMTIWAAGALIAVDTVFVVAYILWFNADEAAVSRAEAAGFDTSQLLPASNLLWVAMNGALVVLLGVNIVAVSAWFAMLARPTIAPDGRTH
ncbi:MULTISPECIES: hypothetical protein [Brevibacterium]